MLMRITAPWFVAGVEILPSGRKRVAPIIHYMENLNVNKVFRYSKKRGWKAEIYREENINNKKEAEKAMDNEQFVPKNDVDRLAPAIEPIMPAVQPPADAVGMQANVALAETTTDVRVTNILQLSTKLRQLQQFKRITDQTQYDQAIDAFNLTRDKIKEIDAIRHEHVDLETMTVKLKNQFFKSIKDDLERTKAHLGGIIDKKKREDGEAAERAQDEAKAKIESGETVVVEKDGVGEVVFDLSETVSPPENVVTSSRGASVQTRTDLGVEVTDLTEFLKTCVSKNKRNLWLSGNVAQFIEIKLTPLKALIKENKKASVPGLTLEQTRRTV